MLAGSPFRALAFRFRIAGGGMQSRYRSTAVALFSNFLALTAALPAQTTQPPSAVQLADRASNMGLVGHDGLQARSAYQPTIQKQGNRWIAYVGHHGGEAMNPLTGKVEPNGTSIVDVTDPKQPKYLFHIPGEPKDTAVAGESGGAQMARVCPGSTLPKADRNKYYLLRTYGETAHEVWDVTDPAKPARVSVIGGKLRDTHKNFWECDTGIAYLISGPVGWRTNRMMQIYDLSDPAKPVFIRDFGLPGQQPSGRGQAAGPMHGAISTGPKGNRVYVAYDTARDGVLEILDREKLLNGPKELTDENLRYPVIARVDMPPDAGGHTALPLLQMQLSEFANQKKGATKDFLAFVGETGDNECQQPRQMLHFFDISRESQPLGVSTYTVNEDSGNFCSAGGRFGTHSINENMTPVFYNRVLFVAHFNAGVRAVDIRDPMKPREIGYFIPAVNDKTDKRCVGTGADQHCKVAVQTNNVEVDERGYIYSADRANTGLHILELTGSARQVADYSKAER
jgi:hypothetical protein